MVYFVQTETCSVVSTDVYKDFCTIVPKVFRHVFFKCSIEITLLMKEVFSYEICKEPGKVNLYRCHTEET